MRVAGASRRNPQDGPHGRGPQRARLNARSAFGQGVAQRLGVASTGEVAERSKAHAWKVCIRYSRIEGSNPSLSAKSIPKSGVWSPLEAPPTGTPNIPEDPACRPPRHGASDPRTSRLRNIGLTRAVTANCDPGTSLLRRIRIRDRDEPRCFCNFPPNRVRTPPGPIDTDCRNICRPVRSLAWNRAARSAEQNTAVKRTRGLPETDRPSF